MRALVLAGIALISTLLSGCSGDEDPGASATVTITKAITVTAEPTATPSDTESEASSDAVELAIGDTATVPWGTIQVAEIDSAVDSDPNVMLGLDHERWVGARVKSCVDDDYRDEDIKLNWSPWSVIDTESGVYVSLVDITGPSWPQPEYPQLGDRTTRPGTCVQGWIVFAVTAGARLAEFVYESASVPEPIVWQLQQ